MSDDLEITAGSGNVFADLGFADPDMEMVRAELALQIGRIITERGWTQTQAAAALGIDQPKVSKIVRGRLGEFSPERLIQYLNRLNHDVRIVIAPNPSPERAAATTVELDSAATHVASR
jgi:predicted XRE-type DNA-binding protein